MRLAGALEPPSPPERVSLAQMRQDLEDDRQGGPPSQSAGAAEEEWPGRETKDAYYMPVKSFTVFATDYGAKLSVEPWETEEEVKPWVTKYTKIETPDGPKRVWEIYAKSDARVMEAF